VVRFSSNIIDAYSNDKLIGLLGVKDLLIIETPDYSWSRMKKYDQRIKEMVERAQKKEKGKIPLIIEKATYTFIISYYIAIISLLVWM